MDTDLIDVAEVELSWDDETEPLSVDTICATRALVRELLAAIEVEQMCQRLEEGRL